MHYIIGTSVLVNPAFKIGFGTKKFKPGTPYLLISIRKEADKVVYIFMDRNRQKVEIDFVNCRDADSFIAKIRNERIPDYDAVQEEPVV